MTDIELIKKYIPSDKQDEALQKLASGYPIQYIIGDVVFYGNTIKVKENVLIPRFETEYLVEKTLKYLKKLNKSSFNILEIGTGTGCISISLKKNLKGLITAIDINEDAIKLAKENAKINNVDINFEVLDIHNFSSLTKYDLIISNPPYVPYNSPVDEKIKYEPKNAIYAKDNGLYFYKVILNKIKNNLTNNYLIALEIGDKEGNILKNISREIFPKAYIQLEYDYNNYERYLFISDIDIF